ncbi:MAG: hypothetical protein ABIT76_11570 [Chthoniobacterales bacterium]
MFNRLLILLAVVCLGQTASGQMQVSLEMTRSLYMMNEPVLAKISITNLSGRDQNFADAPGKPWFSFEIFAGKDSLIPPVNPDYHLGELYVPTGKTVTRNINVTPLYGLQEYGPHSIRAVLYDKDKDQYYTSARRAFEITEGLLLWKQSVGVPAENSTHTYSLLTHRLPAENRLYVRIIDDTGSRVVSCFSIGRVLSFSPPEHVLDSQNNLHVLQMVGPKAYLYTSITPNGDIVSRDPYIDGRSNPHLVRNENGEVRVRGGKMESAVPAEKKRNIPRLSDRPHI